MVVVVAVAVAIVVGVGVGVGVGVVVFLLGVQHTSRPFFVHVESVCPDTHHLLAFGSSELP